MILRLWTLDDAPALLPLVLAFLTEHYAVGGDIQPTEENAAHLVALGVHRATLGDPVFLAGDEDGIVGFALWCGTPESPITMRDKVCQGLGTYVVPPRRRDGISILLRESAFIQAAVAGYTRIDGVARDKKGLESSKRVGFTAVGAYVTKEV